jgi:Peptidase family S41
LLTASSLLRDPHAVLIYTLNSRGGFTPHDVEEYVLDARYPGYRMSRESPRATRDQVKREHPEFFDKDGNSIRSNWSPMSSYASIHEQKMKRGLHLSSSTVLARRQFLSDSATTTTPSVLLSPAALAQLQSLAAQKNIVLLINEGTASSAEVFASALHDNGRTVALIGTKTYGKGLVQHTFPMPDGGGLRMTVAEYLTPALNHVTHVGGAQYDRWTGAWVGGGIHPDLVCDSRQGIPANVGADLCVGMALDALEEADSLFRSSGMLTVGRRGGVDDSSQVRRAVQMSVVQNDF